MSEFQSIKIFLLKVIHLIGLKKFLLLIKNRIQSYIPNYSKVEEEIVSVTLNLSKYVTQKEFKNVTKVDTSDFALKTNVAEIKKKVDDIDVDKIDFIDELQGKNFVEDS